MCPLFPAALDQPAFISTRFPTQARTNFTAPPRLPTTRLRDTPLKAALSMETPGSFAADEPSGSSGKRPMKSARISSAESDALRPFPETTDRVSSQSAVPQSKQIPSLLLRARTERDTRQARAPAR